MTHNRRILLVLLMLMAVLIVACGGDDGDDSGANDTQDTVQGDNFPPGFDPNAEITPDPSVPDDLPPFFGENSDGPPDIGDDGEEGGDSALPFGDGRPPGIDPSAGPGTVITDFSTLEPGQRVTLMGRAVLLPEADANGNPITLLIDSNGVEVRFFGLPLDIASNMSNADWNLTGMIQDEREDGRLVLEARADQMPTAVLPDVPDTLGANPGGDAPFPIDPMVTADPFGVAIPGQPPGLPGSDYVNTGITLEVPDDVTALAAYDALAAALAEDLSNTELLEISGSPQAGWLMQFRLTDAELTTTYRVEPGGAVLNSPPAPVIDIPIAATIPIDRARVVVDSDVAAAQFMPSENEGPPIGMLAGVSLRATEDGNIVWTSPNTPGTTLDATTAP